MWMRSIVLIKKVLKREFNVHDGLSRFLQRCSKWLNVSSNATTKKIK